MEQLPEMFQGYSADGIWSINELMLFLKFFHVLGWQKKLKSVKVARNQKSDLLWYFLCPRVDSTYLHLLLLERVKSLDAFQNCQIFLNRMVCSIFTAKTWMIREIMIQVLSDLDFKLHIENRKVMLFPDNAPSHPKILQENLKKIKLLFLSKNTTSQLQSCDAGIIRNFKVKHHMQLLKHVISRIDNRKKSSEIIQRIDILQCMRWVNQASEEITKNQIKHCFKKCEFSEVPLLG